MADWRWEVRNWEIEIGKGFNAVNPSGFPELAVASLAFGVILTLRIGGEESRHLLADSPA